MSQEIFYWTQSIYAILGIILFIILIRILVGMYKRLEVLDKKINLIADKGLEAAENARKMAESGEKLALYGVYKILTKYRKRRNWCDDV